MLFIVAVCAAIISRDDVAKILYKETHDVLFTDVVTLAG